MNTFYEMLSDGTIGRSTPDAVLAQELNLSLQTEKEIVYGHDSRRYFKGEEPTPPQAGYAEKRQKAYPPITEQLDMIYWDNVNNTDFWKTKITEIKKKYPKTN